LYENNIAYAADLFEIFLKTIRTEVGKLEGYMRQKDVESIKNQVHKLKPNFAMVGLTWLKDRIQETEDTLRDDPDQSIAQMEALYEEISVNMNRYFPIIEDELEKMLTFIKENGLKR
jgi:HPt (histidine-containing phosphotransfer) domain-containing protein